jgi:hypothetical protein
VAGLKGRSGPPNNTNATRYSWRLLWRRALLRSEDQWVCRPLALYTEALIDDKPHPTAGEQNVIEIAATAKGCGLLILNELKQKGFTCTIDGVLELTPAARELSRFLSVELSALKVLGLERRLRPAISLNEYLNGKSTKGTQP